MKKKKAGIIASSVAAIAVCSSMVVGSTLALFTSEDKVNIAVTSGNVSVEANILNSDNATVNGKEVSLTNIVAGENATIELEIVNKSTVSVSYRLGLNVTNDNGLFAGLNIGVKEEGLASTGTFAPVSAAEKESGKQEGTLTLSIGLPESAGNAYMDKTCKIELSVEAIQGNANFTKSSGNVELINSAEELEAFRDRVNGGANYANKYVMLMSDIDLENKAWTPIGNCLFEKKTIMGNSVVYPEFGAIDGGNHDKFTPFAGTFNGNGKAVSNFTVGSAESEVKERADLTGLFGVVGSSYRRYDKNGSTNHYYNYYENEKDFSQRIVGKVTNLTVEGAEVYGRENVGGAVAYLEEGGVIDNVTVRNSTVDGGHWVGGVVGYTCRETQISNCQLLGGETEKSVVKATPYLVGEKNDNGDKVGGIVGYFCGDSLTDCTVDGAEISAFRDFGGIAGYVGTGACEYWNETETAEGTFTYTYAGAIYQDGKATGNKAMNIILAYVAADNIADKNENCNQIFGRTSEGTNSSKINNDNANKKATLTLANNTFENVVLP